MPDMFFDGHELSAPVVLKKVKMVADMAVGDTLDDVFQVDAIEKKQTKRRSEYFKVTLLDRTGDIRGNAWEAGGVDPDIKAGDFVKARFTVEEYNGDLQIKVALLRRLNVNETVDIGDFTPSGPDWYDRFKTFDRFKALINFAFGYAPLRELCLAVFETPALAMRFRDAPAAKTMHHAHLGGLLRHSFSMAMIATALMEHYSEEQSIELDGTLLVAAALFHDIGKTEELSWHRGFRYTIPGSLVGHVTQGQIILESLKPVYFAQVVPEDLEKATHLWWHLQHLIASHHGNLEWGAAKTPMTREAQIFHIVDMIDSRMGAFDTVATDSADALGFTRWEKFLGGPAWLPEAVK